MAPADSASFRRPSSRWWQRLVAWIRRLLRRRPRLLRAARPGWRAYVASLPDDLHHQVGELSDKGVVWDTVTTAIEDYGHLRDVMMGPGATTDSVNDVELLAEAEAILRSLIARAPAVQILVGVAGNRRADRAGREATGEAILQLRDEARLLHEAASAAIRWASTQSEQDRARLAACGARLAGAADRSAAR